MSKEENTPYSFKGDNAKLVDSIKSLLALDSKGALVPNGIGGLARQLLESAVERLGVGAPPMAFEISSYGGMVDRIVVREDVATAIYNKRVAEGAEDVRVRPLYAHAESSEVERLRDELRSQTLRADAAVGDANEAERSLRSVEQKNAALIELLRETSGYLDGSTRNSVWCDSILHKKMKAAIQPAESGESA